MKCVQLMGRLTKDPEIRYTQSSNIAVANFTLAVNRRFAKDTDKIKADFINIVVWNKSAELVSKYFKKGMQVAIEGRIQTRTWDDDQGQKHYATEVIAESVYFADSKKDNLGNSSNEIEQKVNDFNSQGMANPFDNNDDLPF